MNKKYVPIETIKYELSKIRKHSNFQYKRAIDRNRINQVKHPPLIKLISFLRNNNYSEADVDLMVAEYWDNVEKNNKFEKDIVNEIKMKYKR
jgi:hypothetical protein